MSEHLLGDVALPADMVWSDEFNWPTVVRSTEYAITGALIIDSAQRLAGRPITLSGTADGGWVSRATVDALRVLACELPGQVVLTLADGRGFQVIFSPDDPLTAEPVVPFSDPSASTWYVVTVKLIEV
jgi:hypothetical protein